MYKHFCAIFQEHLFILAIHSLHGARPSYLRLALWVRENFGNLQATYNGFKRIVFLPSLSHLQLSFSCPFAFFIIVVSCHREPSLLSTQVRLQETLLYENSRQILFNEGIFCNTGNMIVTSCLLIIFTHLHIGHLKMWHIFRGLVEFLGAYY